MLKAENYIQQECLMWFNNNYCMVKHEPRCVIFSVPNETEHGWEAKKKTNTGLMKGASDLIILMPGITLFMECKTPVGVQSPDQIIFQHRVELIGFKYHLFRSLEQFQNIVNQYITWQKKS